jgi:hypothetical protein
MFLLCAEKHLFHDYFLDFLYFYVCFFYIIRSFSVKNEVSFWSFAPVLNLSKISNNKRDDDDDDEQQFQFYLFLEWFFGFLGELYWWLGECIFLLLFLTHLLTNSFFS